MPTVVGAVFGYIGCVLGKILVIPTILCEDVWKDMEKTYSFEELLSEADGGLGTVVVDCSDGLCLGEELGDDFEGLVWEGAVKLFLCNFFSIFYSLF